MKSKTTLSETIRTLAAESGIDVIGFAKADAFSNYALQGTLRHDPRRHLKTAKSIIVAGIYIGGIALPNWEDVWMGRTSRLLLSGFFLDVVEPLQPIAGLLRKEGYRAEICNGAKEGGSILPLKLAAVRAGLGWQGKHSLIISKRFGTFLALGGMITDAPLEPYGVRERDRCRDCDKCRRACPLSALDQPYVLEKERCLSFCLQAVKLPPEAQAAMENRVADCEICQYACPWNRKHLSAPLATPRVLAFQKKISQWEAHFRLPNLARLSKRAYEEQFGRFATDIPYELFRRNVALALVRAKSAQDHN